MKVGCEKWKILLVLGNPQLRKLSCMFCFYFSKFFQINIKAPLHERISMKNLWRISQNFLHTCHSSSIFQCISSKNVWRICEEYVTVYCLKFYIILNKFKSVWIYLKLWRILNNILTLNTIEVWNLNRFKGTCKHEKIKDQKQRKRESFLWVQVMKNSNMDSQGYYHEMQNGHLFWQMQQEKIQHENL